MATMTLRTRSRVRFGLAAGAALTSVALIAGCSTNASNDTGEPSGTLRIVVSSADASDAAFKAINEAFEEKYPDVTVEFSPVPNDQAVAVIASRLSANNVDIVTMNVATIPDYVIGDVKSDEARGADAGVYLDLTDEPFMDNFTDSVLDVVAYNDQQLSVPLGLSYYTGAYYNKTMFEEMGLTLPTTWSEFVTLCETLEAAGISPLGIGGKDSWPAGLTMNAAVQGLYPTQEDKQDLARGLWSQDIKLTDDGPQEILDRVQQFYDFAQPNFAGVDYAAIPAGFANGEFAMTVDGTWNQPTIDAAVGDKFEYGYFPVPTSENADDNKFLGGKADLRLSVASGTKNKVTALAWLDFLTDPANYEAFAATAGFVPAEPDIPAGEFLDSIAVYTSTFSPAWDTQWTGNPNAGPNAGFPFNYPAIAPLGTSTPAEAAEIAEKDWAAGF